MVGDSIDRRLRGRYLHNILEGDTWLTHWVQREPVRLVRTQFGGGWDREDPLDFNRDVRHISTNWPTTAEFAKLYRHLIALMLAVSFVSYCTKFVVGHGVAAYGRPLFERGFGYAALFGVVAGTLFAVITIFGTSSLSGLVLGLISGLALVPSLGTAEGLKGWFADQGGDVFIAFIVMLLTNMLGEGRQIVIGVLVLLFGVYLQALPLT